MTPPVPRKPDERWLLPLLLVPVLLLAVTLRVSLASGGGAEHARVDPSAKLTFGAECQFPGSGPERQRLVVVAVDSLRDETAFDRAIMPWLSAHRTRALWGSMQPCVSQLSLLCFRTMFEGAEPLLATGFHNYTGMSVAADNLIQRLARRGVRVAAVADQAFVSLYRDSLTRHATFEERAPGYASRDAYGRETTLRWLDDRSLDVVVSHVIDTDATSHRVGIGHPEYVAKFRETDDFLKEVSAKLGERDSLIVLGDHGHDAHGYHSTGIPSQTAYFASGPWFRAGVRADTVMATTLFLMGAVTCEPVSTSYQGTFPISTLTLPEAYARSQRQVENAHAPLRAARSTASPVRWEAPAVLALLALIVFASRATSKKLRAAAGSHSNLEGWGSAKRGALASLSLVPGLAIPSALVLWAAAAALWASSFREFLAERRLALLVAAGFALSLCVGLSGHLGLVTLQNHVNPRWTVGFWGALVIVILVLGSALGKAFAIPRRHAIGVTAAVLIFVGLGFGPYYYGTARNLLYGTTWLLLSHALELRRREPAIWKHLALAVLPLVPLYAPVLKEWQPTYPLLTWFEAAGPGARLAVTAAAFGVLLSSTRERRRRLRLGLTLGAISGLGLVLDLGAVPWLNATLLFLSYVGFANAAERAEASLDSASRRWVLPLGQAMYAFMMFFVLLGALRFANVDYRFALSLTPIELGEGRAALVALPIVTAKYVLPICLLLLAGPRLRVETLLWVLVKAGCLAAGLVGLELAARTEARLFLELQTQETALVAVLYMPLFVLFLTFREQVQEGGQDQHTGQHTAELAGRSGDAEAPDGSVDRDRER
jgi:hypothetical protein